MTVCKNNIEKLPFFHSFMQDSSTKAVIDVKAFNLWLQSVQHMDFLSKTDEAERTEAYKELENGKALDLKEALKEW